MSSSLGRHYKKTVLGIMSDSFSGLEGEGKRMPTVQGAERSYEK